MRLVTVIDRQKTVYNRRTVYISRVRRNGVSNGCVERLCQ